MFLLTVKVAKSRSYSPMKYFDPFLFKKIIVTTLKKQAMIPLRGMAEKGLQLKFIIVDVFLVFLPLNIGMLKVFFWGF